MSHHTERPDPEMAEQIKRFYQRYTETTKQAVEALTEAVKLGPTGNFPEGKLTQQDEGEFKLAITRVDGKVIMAFGTPIAWIGMTRNDAIQIGNDLIKHARKLPIDQGEE